MASLAEGEIKQLLAKRQNKFINSLSPLNNNSNEKMK
jgi:hypothetical protein